MGAGAKWTRLYAPVRLIEAYQCDIPFEEDRKTKELMALYGIDKVRGGTYVNEELDQYTVAFLQKEIWTGQNKCGRCGKSGHYITDCISKYNVRNELIEREYYR